MDRTAHDVLPGEGVGQPTLTLPEFCERHGIKIRSTRTPARTDRAASDWDKSASHWIVTLTRGDSDPGSRDALFSISTPYSMGSAHRRWKLNAPRRHEPAQYTIEPGQPARFHGIPGRGMTIFQKEAFDQWTEPTPPEAPDVLHSLFSDAQSGNESFAEFCGNLGYDEDSRKALDTYLTCQRIAQDLLRFLGPALYRSLEEEVEPY